MKKSMFALIALFTAVMLLFSACVDLNSVDLISNSTVNDAGVLPTDVLSLPPSQVYSLFGVGDQFYSAFEWEHNFLLSNWFPVKKIASTTELADFVSSSAIPQDTLREGYDDTFFADNVLLLGVFSTSSGGGSYALSMIAKEGNTLTVGVETLFGGADCSIEEHLLVVELSQEEVKDTEIFSGCLSDKHSSKSEEDHDVVTKLTFGKKTYLFSGQYARKLTEDLAELTFEPTELDTTQFSPTAEITTVYGNYVYSSFYGDIFSEGGRAKYALWDTLQCIVDYYPDMIVQSFTGDIGCLNEDDEALLNSFGETLIPDMKPVIRLDSWDELTELVATVDSEFRNPENSAQLKEFIQSKKELYGESFFTDHGLLFTYVVAGSGSYSYTLTNVQVNSGRLQMDIRKDTPTLFVTNDMAGWIVAVKVPKTMLADVTQYGASVQ